MKAVLRLFQTEAAAGIILMLATVLAMICANTGLAPYYHGMAKDTDFLINDVLMVFFFLLAGLEIKKEITGGALNGRKALQPFGAAVCGMVVPALVYLGVTWNTPDLHHGWAIPSATDIAFAIGVLALLSKRVPASLKVLLLAIAVMDDLGAIIVIAFFYGESIAGSSLFMVLLPTLVLAGLNRRGIQAYTPYMIAGFVLWAALLNAGIHPTIGGVVLGFSIPQKRIPVLEHALHPWVMFFIMPLFAFANAGVTFTGMTMQDLTHPVVIAIALGLLVGKPLGIYGAIYGMARTGLSPLGDDMRMSHILGVGLLCGVGFTMSLFIGDLAFTGPDMGTYVRIGVIGGSLLSGLLGYTVLLCSGSRSHTGLSK
jgi:NhaA family Na+:H+ antiporter